MAKAVVLRSEAGIPLEAISGSWIRLDGAASDGESFAWSVVGGPPGAQLREPDAATPLFSAVTPGSYVVKLTVADPGVASPQDSDTVEILVRALSAVIRLPANETSIRGDGEDNLAPLESFNAIDGESFSLDGSGSRGPEGIRHVWGMQDAETLVMLHPRGDRARVNPLEQGSFKVTLRVAATGLDEGGRTIDVFSDPAVVTVSVDAAEDTGPTLPYAVHDYWEKQQDDALRASLATARESATTWQGAITAGVGVVGVVGFIAAPNEIDKIPTDGIAVLALAIFSFAIIAAVVAWLKLQGAADSTPEFAEYSDMAQYRQAYIDAATSAARTVKGSKAFVMCSVVLFAAGTILIAADHVVGSSSTDDEAGDSGTSVLVIDQSGAVACGKADTADTGALTIDGTAISDAVTVKIVDACPTTTTAPPATDQD